MSQPLHHKFFAYRGFTLLEVLVALAVLAIALSAILTLASQSAMTLGDLRDQTLASWVARNQINQLLLERGVPAIGERDGQVEMAQRVWFWRVRISETSDEDLRRLDVSVSSRANEAPLVTLSAFKGE